MASALLASHNESSYMGKFPYSNPHLNPNPNSTSNSKSIPAKRKITADHNQVNGRYVDEYAADVNQSGPDDASSFNHRRSYNSGTNGDQFLQGEYISFDTASLRPKELVQLKMRFNAELDQIRSLKNRIESGEFQRQWTVKKEEKKISSKKCLTEPKRSQPGVTGSSNKESKRFMLSESDKTLMKMCGQVLGKLMKHKRGYIFNVPVDAIALGLHDYHQIVKQPMDLGTVKMKLGKNMYETPLEFASDVRLTFENAMLYNPKGHEVHELAGQFLFRFDDLFRPIHIKCPHNQPQQQHQHWGCSIVDDLQESSWNQTSKTEKIKKTTMVDITKKQERMPAQETVPHRSSSNPPLPQSPVRTSLSPERASPMKVLTKTKQPKPKAKDPTKREMSMMEKHKLGVGLQSLPDEKMPQVVHIIKKRNPHLAEEGDEIELDIEVLDTETLWELDRFVTNWKKLASKGQALMGTSGATMDGGTVYTNVEPDIAMPVKKAKKGADGGEDDVDIGDDIPMSSFPPVEIEKDEGNGHASSSSSSSSGSSSSSSSSSDSDSGSSSGSDSDADNAQSKDFSRT